MANVGEVLDHCPIPSWRSDMLSFVGQGVWNSVYRLHTAQNLPLALKCMPLFDHEELRREQECFLEYERQIARLRHPNLLPLLLEWRTATAQRLVYYYQPFTLRQWLQQQQQQHAVVQSSSLARQLLSVVQHLHNHSWSHNDIKPDNIMVNAAGTQLWLVDFSAVRPVPVDGQIMWNQDLTTLWYRSPEMQQRTEFFTTRSDVWSVGCVLYECVTGEVLFPARDEHDLKRLLLESLPVPMANLHSAMVQAVPWSPCHRHLSGSWRRWLASLLALSPRRRVTAAQALESLAAL